MLNLVEHLWFLLTCKLLVGIVVFMRICRATGSKSMCFWTSCKKALLFRSISPTVTSPGQIKHDRVNVTIPMSVFMFSGRSDELDVKQKKTSTKQSLFYSLMYFESAMDEIMSGNTNESFEVSLPASPWDVKLMLSELRLLVSTPKLWLSREDLLSHTDTSTHFYCWWNILSTLSVQITGKYMTVKRTTHPKHKEM